MAVILDLLVGIIIFIWVGVKEGWAWWAILLTVLGFIALNIIYAIFRYS